jgi:hypothetical protein
MTVIRTAAITLLLHVVLFSAPSFADAIYSPGGAIGPTQFASTGVFSDFLNGNGTTATGPAGTPVVGQNVQGLGTQELYFDDLAAGTPSNLRFDGFLTDTPVAPRPDCPPAAPDCFLLGILTYTNGIFFVDAFTSAVSLQTTGGSNLASSFTQSFTGRVVANITVNAGLDPEDDADIITFQNGDFLGSMRVYEGQAGAIQVLAKFGSLDLVAFGAVVSAPGSAFFFNGTGALPIGFVPTDTGNGTFIPAAPQTPVPEPATVTLLGSALALTLRKLIRRH